MQARRWRIEKAETMFSVIFEVHPHASRKDEYLSLAKHLKPILERMDGFIDNERFESLTRPGWILSHSTWRDEKSLIRWRTEGEHHCVQEKGRNEVFQDYHLRVGEVTADTDPPAETYVRGQRFDETEKSPAKGASFTEITPEHGVDLTARAETLPQRLGRPFGPDVIAHDVFASIYNPGKLALLVAWRNCDAAAGWTPARFDDVKGLRHRTVRVIRDYGRFDRHEAPQYYPEVA